MWPFSGYPVVSCANVLEEYDYIIIGGGTAGCVLANRLSADRTTSVLVVERGKVADGWTSNVPLLSFDFNSDRSRTIIRKTVPQSNVGNQILELVGGKALGGTSRINGMLYTRGVPAEYDAWALAGRKGWSFDELLPYFVKSENAMDGENEPWHGKNGEWKNHSFKTDFWPHIPATIRAVNALGIPYVVDVNAPHHPSVGVARMHHTIDTSGRRSSTFTSFLPAHLARSRKKNLHICTETAVSRIEITKTTGSEDAQAEGVWLLPDDPRLGSKTKYVRARKEVILSAGPMGSPHVLMLSGIGPREHLTSHGIAVMKDLPGVGSHLQDHLAASLVFSVPYWHSMVVIQKLWVFLYQLFLYMIWGTGMLLAPISALTIFARSQTLDDTYHHVINKSADVDPRNPKSLPDIEILTISWGVEPTSKSHKLRGGLSFLVLLTRPESKGTVRLRSSDPRDDLLCDLAFLTSGNDRRVMRRAVRFGMRIKEQMKLQGYEIEDAEVPKSDSDEDIDETISKTGRTTYHYSSTCRMAPEDDVEPGVVDDNLRVHGVRGLRVADSSILPQIAGTHIQAITVVIAEKCADMILHP